MIDSIRDVKLFVAAYEERSFTLAAVRENASQSGVSQHIKKIEDRAGVQLFTRQKGKVVSTPAGDSYYRCCIEILRASEAANRTLADFSNSLAGEIYVGLMPTMTRSCVAPTLTEFVKKHPNVTIKLEEAYSGVLTDRVLAGELDFAIVPPVASSPGLKVRKFVRTIETVVSGPNSPFRHLQPLRLAEVKPLRLVLPSASNARRHMLASYFAVNSISVDKILDLDSMMGTLDFVRNSSWLSILPGIMMFRDTTNEGHGLVVNPIVSPLAFLDLMIIEPARNNLSHAAFEFLALLQAEAARQNHVWNSFMKEP